MKPINPCLLVILDGWGHRQASEGNAIAQAHTPYWQAWWPHYPHALLHCSGPAVGLPKQQMGNSEVGHLHLGAGRIVDQTLTRIDRAMNQPNFHKHRIFKQYLDPKVPVHILGLLSPGGVHSHEQHIYALLKVLKYHQVAQVYLHVFLDGRDAPPQSAERSLHTLIEHMHQLGIGTIASLCGRYYAMDRDKRWNRTKRAYQLLVAGQGLLAADPISALQEAYQRQEYDEFIQPYRFIDFQPIDDQSIVFFMNFRSDRAKQLVQALMDPSSQMLPSIKPPKALIGLTDYNDAPISDALFPKIPLTQTLGHVVAEAGLRQFRIAETEKYAHVTYFFNGGQDAPLPGEVRQLIPSLHVATYDQRPEMSAGAITDRLIQAMQANDYALYVCNYANPDMVGHTGNFEATKQAIAIIDECLGRLFKAAQMHKIQMYITADHGNAEQMYDLDHQQPHTRHTNHLVPFLSLTSNQQILRTTGQLIDVAPTLLSQMNLPIPKCMTGQLLLKTIKT